VSSVAHPGLLLIYLLFFFVVVSAASRKSMTKCNVMLATWFVKHWFRNSAVEYNRIESFLLHYNIVHSIVYSHGTEKTLLNKSQKKKKRSIKDIEMFWSNCAMAKV
jgi:hypothetical protein